MYFKLALANVKKSYKDYFIYFLTLAFSVCMFFTFNSFQEQQAVMDMTSAQSDLMQQLAEILMGLSVIVALILGFLILYANNFLIKRRKKEFGLYTLLGMPKRKISRIVVYETFLIGLLSLIVGMLLGIGLSQVLSVVSANLFTIPLDYHFIFSKESALMTIGAFSLIFVIVMIFNTFILNKYQLIDLLYADRKNDDLHIKNVKVYVILFILSLVLLATAYGMAWDKGLDAFAQLKVIVPLGVVGTFLFFLSLAGFLLRFVKTSKRIYYRNLNMFVLREVNSSIRSNFISMSFVCLLLLFSIGALSTGFSLNATINSTMKFLTPYDISFALANTGSEYQKVEDDLQLKQMDGIEEIHRFDIYEGSLDAKELVPYLDKKSGFSYFFQEDSKEKVDIVSLSDYNQLLKDTGAQKLSLKEDEAVLLTTNSVISKEIKGLEDRKQTLTQYGNRFSLKDYDYDMSNIATVPSGSSLGLALVINDEQISRQAVVNESYVNINLNDENKEASVIQKIKERMEYLNATGNAEDYYYASYQVSGRNDTYMQNKGMTVISTYVGIYLGIVFLISSSAILALQQLSKASDNKKRYKVLSQIGSDEHMINRSLLLQLAIYFIIPLLLAVMHSIVGINVVNGAVLYLGKTDIGASSAIAASILILIYGTYFIVTYIGCKNIIKS